MSLVAVPEGLRAAGQSAAGLADQLGAVNLAGPADALGGWLPGGAAAAAGDELATVWQVRLADLVRQVDSHATALSGAGDTFHGQDENNAAGLPRGVR